MFLNRPISYHLFLYLMASCGYLMVLLSPMYSHPDIITLFTLIDSPVVAITIINTIIVVLLAGAFAVRDAVFGPLTDDEAGAIQDACRQFIMLKSVYFLSSLYSARFADLIVWITCFYLCFGIRGFIILTLVRTKSIEQEIDVGGQMTDARVSLLLRFVSCMLLGIVAVSAAIARVLYPAGITVLSILLFEPLLTTIQSLLAIYQLWSIHSLADASIGVGGQSSFAFHIESITDIVIQALTMVHLAHVWALQGVALTVVDLFMFLILRSLWVRLTTRMRGLMAYRAVMHEINTRFPDASQQEISDLDDDCAICREPLLEAKRLPCAHYFHSPCLRQWMKYRRTCPICRSSLLPDSAPPAPTGTVIRRLIRFQTGQWPAWVPRISFELIRGHPGPAGNGGPINMNNNVAATIGRSLDMLQEIFPERDRAGLLTILSAHQGHIGPAMDALLREQTADGAVIDPPNGTPVVVPQPAVVPALHNTESDQIDHRRAASLARLEARARGHHDLHMS